VNLTSDEEEEMEQEEEDGESAIDRLKTAWRNSKAGQKCAAMKTNAQWATIIKVIMALATVAFGTFIIMGYITEARMGIGTYPGIGTAWIVLPFYLMGMICLYLLAHKEVHDEITRMDYVENNFVFPPAFEQVFSRDGQEREKDLDANDLEQQRWTGIEADPLYIDAPDTLLKSIVKTQGAMVKAEERDAIIKEYEKYMEYRKTTLTSLKEKTGREFYLYYFKYNKWTYWTERDAKGKKGIRSFIDALVILNAPKNEALRFTPHRVPANGFKIMHSHSERMELVLKDVLFGNLPLFVCTSCAYIRHVNQQPMLVPDEIAAMAIIDTASYFYAGQRTKNKPLEEDLMNLVAERDQLEDALKTKNARAIMNVLRNGQGAAQMSRESQVPQPRIKQKENDAAMVAAVVGIIAAVIMLLLYIFK